MEFLRQVGVQQQKQVTENLENIGIKSNGLSHFNLSYKEEGRGPDINNFYDLQVCILNKSLTDNGIFFDTYLIKHRHYILNLDISSCSFKLEYLEAEESKKVNRNFNLEFSDTDGYSKETTITLSQAPQFFWDLMEESGFENKPEATRVFNALKSFECPTEKEKSEEKTKKPKVKKSKPVLEANLNPEPEKKAEKPQPLPILGTENKPVISGKNHLPEITPPKIEIPPSIPRAQIEVDNGCVDKSVFDQFCAKVNEFAKNGLTEKEVTELELLRKDINGKVYERTGIQDFIALPSGNRTNPEYRGFYAPYESTCGRRDVNKNGFIPISH